MEEIQQTESHVPGPAAGVIRAQSATGDLRLHEFHSRIFRNTRFLRLRRSRKRRPALSGALSE
jgi:hypothetical protein